MQNPKKITVDLAQPEQEAVARIRVSIAEKQGRASISDAIRHSLLKTAKGLRK